MSKIIDQGTAEGTELTIDEHASYIVDLAKPLLLIRKKC